MLLQKFRQENILKEKIQIILIMFHRKKISLALHHLYKNSRLKHISTMRH